jgi:hypothetical protein
VASRTSASLAVRRFARTVDDPAPGDFRTRGALARTMAHLRALLDRGDVRFGLVHKFLWDRYRSVRQDLYIQGMQARRSGRGGRECGWVPVVEGRASSCVEVARHVGSPWQLRPHRRLAGRQAGRQAGMARARRAPPTKQLPCLNPTDAPSPLAPQDSFAAGIFEEVVRFHVLCEHELCGEDQSGERAAHPPARSPAHPPPLTA